MQKVCVIQNEFSDCIGSNSNCIHNATLQQIFNVEASDSSLYSVDYYVSMYECQTAYNITINEFDCLTTVGIKGYDQMKKCETELQADNGNDSDVCSVKNSVNKCVMDVFDKYCGKDAAAYVCNVNNAGINENLPQCASKLMTCPELNSF
uniref:DUF725 domain-containing protein n=1 Tax=Rhabditophanes sp. KR3021 TaxID=114890 RepID=A0AC35UHM4_9BILA